MSFLDRFLKRADKPPEWASFFNSGEFARFIQVVDSEMARSKVAFRIDPAAGMIHAEEPGKADGNTFGLLNVAQMCAQSPKIEWAHIVHEHFERLLKSRTESESSMSAFQDSFELARPMLKLRLYPADSPADPSVVYSPAEEMIAALVYDLPNTVMTVSKDHVSAWGIPREDLFRIALDNVRSEPGIVQSSFDLPEGCKLHALTGDSFFTASRALLLEEHLPTPLPAFGALVAMPNRHTVLFHPITDKCCRTALNAMLGMAQGLYKDGPGSISSSIYWWREAAWWHEGQFTRFPSTLVNNKINLEIPTEFTAQVLDKLT